MALAEQLPLDLPSRSAVGREDFLVTPCNEAAVAWIDRWPNWPMSGLALYGPAACGKTHLAEVWRRRTHALALDWAALAAGEEAHSLLGSHLAVVLDDAENGLSGAGEEALFHLHNLLVAHGGQMLLIGEQAPARWNITLADLRSRLNALPAVAVEPPDDALLAAVLVKQFADRQLALSQEVLVFLLARMERSFAAARKIAAEIDTAALARRKPVTVPLVREVLAQLTDGCDPR